MNDKRILIIPEVNELTRPYWQGATRGKLMLQRCSSCGLFRHPPAILCANCWSTETEWVASSGNGVIYSYTTVFHPVHKAVEGKVPYNVVLIELDEGVRLVSTVVDVPPEGLAIGQRVTVVFETLSPEVGLPKFRLLKDLG